MVNSLFEQPEDVLRQWLDWDAQDGAALAVITSTSGGAVRNTGALMAIARDGSSAGYVSGGCIDADVVLQGVNSLTTGEPGMLLYGAGSPFKDLPLPCGGAIELAVLPRLQRSEIYACWKALSSRRSSSITLHTPNGPFKNTYFPKLRVRIAGRGTDAVALASISEAAGFSTTLWLREADISEEMETLAVPLTMPTALPEPEDDPWTAFVLMFHDPDWEIPLLRQAIAGPAFYIGAVGSRKTHAKRRKLLFASGVSAQEVDRVRGPIGLVPSLRDASLLSISTLAEIVEAYKGLTSHKTPPDLKPCRKEQAIETPVGLESALT